MRDKRLGLLKHCILESKKYTAGDVRILWRQKMVAHKGKKVGWYDGEVFKTATIAKEFQAEVEQLLESWIAKRRQDPETDTE